MSLDAAPPGSVPGRPTVYLAGPDVFYPDAQARGERMKALCAARGWQGLFPLDAEGEDGLAPGLAIYQANRRLIAQADGVVANLRDFRGFEPDSGTVWEVAHALALGKPVVGYLPQRSSLLERLGNQVRHGRDAQGCLVEDFGLPLNLMLAHSLHGLAFGPEQDLQGLQAALQLLAPLLARAGAAAP